MAAWLLFALGVFLLIAAALLWVGDRSTSQKGEPAQTTPADGGFPKIRYQLDDGLSFSPNERFKDLLLLRPLITNNDETVVSISFRMTAKKHSSKEHPLAQVGGEQPINLAPGHSVRPDLQFRWFGIPFLPEGEMQTTYAAGPLAHDVQLTLHIDEHNSGQAIHLWPFARYPNDPAFWITFASYGIGDKTIDPSDRLNTRARDGRVNFIVDNATMGGDPAPDEPKVLMVRWVSNGQEFSSSFAEGTHVALPD